MRGGRAAGPPASFSTADNSLGPQPATPAEPAHAAESATPAEPTNEAESATLAEPTNEAESDSNRRSGALPAEPFPLGAYGHDELPGIDGVTGRS